MRALLQTLVVFGLFTQNACADLPVEPPRDRILFPHELKPVQIKEKLELEALIKKLNEILEGLEKNRPPQIAPRNPPR